MAQRINRDFLTQKGVRRVWVDLRDQDYLPTLSVLKESVSMDPSLLTDLPGTSLKAPVFGVRHRGTSGRCVGFALASPIDIQRSLQWRRAPAGEQLPMDCRRCRQDIASADMLYHMAYFHDRYPDIEELTNGSTEGVRTLRSVVKGFYHHGTCHDWPDPSPLVDKTRWQITCYSGDDGEPENRFPTYEQADKAREIGLGAYFRLASVLNHFHAALNDAGAVLVSANIHDGWHDAKSESHGLIAWPPEQGQEGSHAFVLVGYDRQGFHVLNSWGEDWGGYKGVAGIGLWDYADWARNIIDSWVLRLGVSAPTAFGASIGEKGIKGRLGTAQSGSTPCVELIGHYMHLNDDYHVTSGAYPSPMNGWNQARDHLIGHSDQRSGPDNALATGHDGLLVWIPGSMEGIHPAFTAAVERKVPALSLGLYPYTLFWCNSFVQKSLEVPDTIFDSCERQAGTNAPHLDSLIEQQVQRVGRALWRDIEMSARRAVRGIGELPYELEENDSPRRPNDPGYVANFFADIVQMKVDTGCQLHLVVEGAGALILQEMLSLACNVANDATTSSVFREVCTDDIFDSLHLVHPAIGMPRASRWLVPLICRMNGELSGKRRRTSTAHRPNVQSLLKMDKEPRARIYVPTAALEEDVHFGLYGKSILHLVARSFEDRQPVPQDATTEGHLAYREPRQFLGMASIADDRDFPAPGAFYRLNRTGTQTNRRDRVSQTELVSDPTITNSIFETIRNLQK